MSYEKSEQEAAAKREEAAAAQQAIKDSRMEELARIEEDKRLAAEHEKEQQRIAKVKRLAAQVVDCLQREAFDELGEALKGAKADALSGEKLGFTTDLGISSGMAPTRAKTVIYVDLEHVRRRVSLFASLVVVGVGCYYRYPIPGRLPRLAYSLSLAGYITMLLTQDIPFDTGRMFARLRQVPEPENVARLVVSIFSRARAHPPEITAAALEYLDFEIRNRGAAARHGHAARILPKRFLAILSAMVDPAKNPPTHLKAVPSVEAAHAALIAIEDWLFGYCRSVDCYELHELVIKFYLTRRPGRADVGRLLAESESWTARWPDVVVDALQQRNLGNTAEARDEDWTAAHDQVEAWLARIGAESTSLPAARRRP